MPYLDKVEEYDLLWDLINLSNKRIISVRSVKKVLKINNKLVPKN